MSIDAIKGPLAGITFTKPEAPKGIGQAEESKQSFGQVFNQALQDVDKLQKTADNKITDLVAGKSASPHDAMIALEKADVAFTLMNQIRSKIIRAYEEVMRTQV